MEDLWVEFDKIEAEIQGHEAAIEQLKKNKWKIIAKLRRVPSDRDLKICNEYLRGIKESEIAEKNGLTKSRVSQIVKMCMPHMAGKMRKFGKKV